MFNPLRITALVFVYPRPYLDGDAASQVDIDEWSAEFDWREDDWNGLRDITQPVSETIENETGDCEDYAFVAASWAIANNRDGVGLAVCIDGLAPSHMIAYDTEHTYSSGDITQESVSEYLDRSKYDRVIRRRVN